MGWIADLLLESPVPPPNWLPDESTRRAQARLLLRRLFDERRRRGKAIRGRYLAHLGQAYWPISTGLVVSGDEVEAAATAALTELNPPVMQGWSLIFVVAAAASAVIALAAVNAPAPALAFPIALAGLVGSLVLWRIAAEVVGRRQIHLALTATGLVMQRWVDTMNDRPVAVLGDPRELRAVIDGDRLTFETAHGPIEVSLVLWPPSARRSLAGDLRALELEVDVVREA